MTDEANINDAAPEPTTLNVESEEGQRMLERIQKLLTLATKGNTTEGEATAAMEKAQGLLAKYNLDVAALESVGNKESGKREDFKVRGGIYKFQRDLWEAVARLNFCLYWTTVLLVDRKGKKMRGKDMGDTPKRSKAHRIVGRTVNIAATKAMAGYLQDVIERMTRERVGDNTQLFSNWAVSFRQGIADRLVERISARYFEMMDKQRQEARELAEAAAKAGKPTTGMGTAIALADFVEQEEDANNDFLIDEQHGKGTAARLRKERAERHQQWAEEKREREEAYTQWAAANPEEARKKQEEREAAAKEEMKRHARNAARRTGGRFSYGPRDNKNQGAYHAGRDIGDKISIDQQVDSGRGTKIGRE